MMAGNDVAAGLGVSSSGELQVGCKCCNAGGACSTLQSGLRCPLQAVQWLRHGCLPEVVVEGRPPQEKKAAQQARFAARNGYAGGGSQAGATQFQRLGQAVGRLLEELVSVAACLPTANC